MFAKSITLICFILTMISYAYSEVDMDQIKKTLDMNEAYIKSLERRCSFLELSVDNLRTENQQLTTIKLNHEKENELLNEKVDQLTNSNFIVFQQEMIASDIYYLKKENYSLSMENSELKGTNLILKNNLSLRKVELGFYSGAEYIRNLSNGLYMVVPVIGVEVSAVEFESTTFGFSALFGYPLFGTYTTSFFLNIKMML